MDTPPITALPTIRGALRVARSRDQKERPRQDFEDALNGEDGESDDTEPESSEQPLATPLQKDPPVIRREGEDGEFHVDVMV